MSHAPARRSLIQVSGEVDVLASPRKVLELVLDLPSYRHVDPKIRRVRVTPVMDGVDDGRAEVVGSLWLFPPMVDTHLVHLDRWTGATFRGAPGGFARRIYDFTGRFEVAEHEGFTRVRHSYEVDFHPRALQPFVARIHAWMVRDLDEEMARLVAMFA